VHAHFGAAPLVSQAMLATGGPAGAVQQMAPHDGRPVGQAHVPLWQVVPPLQVPQLPPQPSLSQLLPAQFGLHGCFFL
jgi:hypothetical protein